MGLGWYWDFPLAKEIVEHVEDAVVPHRVLEHLQQQFASDSVRASCLVPLPRSGSEQQVFCRERPSWMVLT